MTAEEQRSSCWAGIVPQVPRWFATAGETAVVVPPGCGKSADLAHDVDGLRQISFSVDLRDIGRSVAKDDLGSF